ncbi:MAG: cytidine deaminase [Bacteroidetes bacterium]|nr:MAG: cytidine deaminase [Bacteroidota bacterium]
MKKKNITTVTYEYDSVDELSKEEQILIQKSKGAVNNAYAPYSKFQVGAAVLLENGEIITGTNQENAAYPSGICAERVAIFYANSKFPNVPVKAIAVTAFTNKKYVESPIPPCGSCRQVLVETETRFNTPIKIYLVSESKITVINDAKDLLPLNFDGSSLIN